MLKLRVFLQHRLAVHYGHRALQASFVLLIVAKAAMHALCGTFFALIPELLSDDVTGDAIPLGLTVAER